MNIQDRIAKLEKELVELREYVEQPDPTQDNWSPRVGEIVLVSSYGDEYENSWEVRRFVEMEDNNYVSEDGYFWEFCKPLNDPMVIQLIRHVPGDPMPCKGNQFILVKFGNGSYDNARADDWYWDTYEDAPDSEIVAWAPMHED